MQRHGRVVSTPDKNVSGISPGSTLWNQTSPRTTMPLIILGSINEVQVGYWVDLIDMTPTPKMSSLAPNIIHIHTTD